MGNSIREYRKLFFKSKVYPSPATMSLTIEYENIQNHTTELTILDINGNVVLSKKNLIINNCQSALFKWTVMIF